MRTALTAAASAVALLALSACNNGGQNDSAADRQAEADAGPAITEEQIEAKAQALLAELGAPATEEQKAMFAGSFEAVGAEPDWNLDLTPDFVSFQRPGLDEVSAIAGPRDMRAQGAFVVAGPLTIAVKSSPCAYGAAAGNYPYTVSILFEGVVYEGCARQVSGEPAKNRGWAEHIHQFIPAIDLCLQRVTAPPGRVTIAFRNDENQTIVRIIENDGGRAECVLAADGSRIASLEPISDRSVYDGERDPLFTRAPTAAPKGYDNEEVVDFDGQRVGWLSRKAR